MQHLAESLRAQARTLETLANAVESPASDGGPEYVDAKASGIGVHVFRKAARTGEFQVFLVGRRWLARAADVRRYVERQRIDPNAAPKRGGDPIGNLLSSGDLRTVSDMARN